MAFRALWLFTALFKQRQTRGIRRGFYRAFHRGRSVDAGTVELLARACRDLRLDPAADSAEPNL